LRKETAGRILVQPVTQLEISSSAIRDMIAQGRSPLFLLPPEVKAIIDASGCYNGPIASKESITGRR
jgi:nicotinate-nucleotide adenylyltransferase